MKYTLVILSNTVNFIEFQVNSFLRTKDTREIAVVLFLSKEGYCSISNWFSIKSFRKSELLWNERSAESKILIVSELRGDMKFQCTQLFLECALKLQIY